MILQLHRRPVRDQFQDPVVVLPVRVGMDLVTAMAIRNMVSIPLVILSGPKLAHPKNLSLQTPLP